MPLRIGDAVVWRRVNTSRQHDTSDSLFPHRVRRFLRYISSRLQYRHVTSPVYWRVSVRPLTFTVTSRLQLPVSDRQLGSSSSSFTAVASAAAIFSLPSSARRLPWRARRVHQVAYTLPHDQWTSPSSDSEIVIFAVTVLCYCSYFVRLPMPTHVIHTVCTLCLRVYELRLC